MGLHGLCHGEDEAHRHAGLIEAEMEIGGKRECLGQFADDIHQLRPSLGGVHGVAHGSSKSGAVAGHVYFGYHRDAALTGIGFHLGALGLGVVLPGISGHVFRGVEGRVALRLEAEGLVVGQVPVEGVHLEAREEVDFFLELPDIDKRAPHIVHIAAQLEGGPVGDGAGFQFGCSLIAFGHLHQGGGGTDHACSRDGLDADRRRGHRELVRLVVVTGQGIVVGASYFRHFGHRDHRGRRIVSDTGSLFLKKAGQQRALQGIIAVHDAHWF